MTARDTLARAVGRRFARVATNLLVRRPSLWPVLRVPLERQFQRLAPSWDSMRDPGHLAAYESALAALDEAPRRALDLGTGTGAGAFAIARRFPEAEVLGVDIAAGMLAEARRKTPPELARRVSFQRADAARLPVPDAWFELVALANMIPFFDELARVVAPGGAGLFSFSAGRETPIFVPFDRLRSELERRGFAHFAEFQQGKATALLARKGADC